MNEDESLRDRAADELSPQERSSPFGSASLSQEIGKVGGWAHGRYLCKCSKCKKKFLGDKRSHQCLPCAVKMVQESLEVYAGMYNRVATTFDSNPTAQEFLEEDGEGGMACAIVYLRSQVAASERDRNPKGGDLLGSVEDESPVSEGNSPESHLRSQLQKLRQALEPFAKIEPSSFYPSDGSEEEGYTVIPDGKAEDIGISSGPDFTGADLARARAVLQETSPEATTAPHTGGDHSSATTQSQAT